MRYIVNSDDYVVAISFGSDIVYADCECTEYKGNIPSGYSSLEEWYLEEELTLWRWKIIEGNLTLDSTATAPKEESGLGGSREARELWKVFNDEPGEVVWNLERMPPNAFYKMPGVTKVTLTNMTSITAEGGTNKDWGYAFSGCDNLTEVYMPKVTEITLGTTLYLVYRTLTNFYAPELKKIAFNGCSMFKNTKWMSPAYCPKLEAVKGTVFKNFSYSSEWGLSYPQIKYIEGLLCDSCTNLTKVTLIGLVGLGADKTGADYVFQNCEQLSTVDLGENIEYINQYALKLAYSLEKLIIRNPNSVIRMGGNTTDHYGLTDTAPNDTWYLYVPDNLVSAYKTTYGLTRVKGLTEL